MLTHLIVDFPAVSWERPTFTRAAEYESALRLMDKQDAGTIGICQTCRGRIAQPARWDALYCSPACRQKAYRQRVQASVE